MKLEILTVDQLLKLKDLEDIVIEFIKIEKDEERKTIKTKTTQWKLLWK